MCLLRFTRRTARTESTRVDRMLYESCGVHKAVVVQHLNSVQHSAWSVFTWHMARAELPCADQSDHGTNSSRTQGQSNLTTVVNSSKRDLIAAMSLSGGALQFDFALSKADTAVQQRLLVSTADSACAVALVHSCCSLTAALGLDCRSLLHL